MTIKELLEQYLSIQQEIQDLKEERESKSSTVSDVVTGSMEDYPYTQHSITVYGVSNDALTLDRKLTSKEKELERQRLKIEEFLDGVKDSKIRRIIRYKYIKNFTWKQIANRIGKRDEGTPRKILEKFLKDSENSDSTSL